MKSRRGVKTGNGKIKYICEFCGKICFSWPSEGKHRVCSYTCWGKVNTRDKTIERNCKQCGRTFSFLVGDLRYEAKKFCSNQCYHLYCRTGYITKNGYRHFQLNGHPLATKSGNVPEHWLVMYTSSDNPEMIIRLRKERWTIHHLNGNKLDNRIENLELRAPGKHPAGVSIQDMIAVLRLFGYIVELPQKAKVIRDDLARWG